ncbi:MAG: GNAT family N-acetyltransferase [Thermoanaerobaculia bacterium]
MEPASHSSSAEPALGSGYLHPRYADSLAEFGKPRLLPRSGAWILVRPIPDSDTFDAMGGDRLLFCSDWGELANDLGEIRDLVTLTAVTDPFGRWQTEDLRRCFPDLLRPYKEHFVVDLERPAPSAHHRAKVRKALRSIETSVDFSPSSRLDEWERLYSALRTRHRLTGMRAFSRRSFERQLATPGCVAVRALLNGRCIASNLWYVVGDVAYSHLTASDPDGYQLSAAYPLAHAAIEAFAQKGLRWLNLGAGAGASAGREDGLGWFKRGWATGTRPTYLCGRIFHHEEYRRLLGETVAPDYFPGYRRGEFG